MQLRETLLKLGAVENKVFNSFSLDISKFPRQFKEVVFYIEMNAQFVYIRQGDIDENRDSDNLVCIFNSDTHGRLTDKYIKQIVKLLK